MAEKTQIMELIKTTNDVREKYKKFENDTKYNIEKTFKPITEPLKKIEKKKKNTEAAAVSAIKKINSR